MSLLGVPSLKCVSYLYICNTSLILTILSFILLFILLFIQNQNGIIKQIKKAPPTMLNHVTFVKEIHHLHHRIGRTYNYHPCRVQSWSYWLNVQVFHKHEVLCIKNGTKKLRITVIYYTTWNLSIIFKKKTKKLGFNLSSQFLDAQEILKIVVLKTRRRLTNHGKSKPRICVL